MPEAKDQLWTRDFILLTLANLFVGISTYLLLPTLPIFAVKFLSADKSQIGYIMGIYSIASFIVRPLSGYIVDYMGQRQVYLYALGLLVMIMTSYHLAVGLTVLLFIRLLHGFIWSTISTGGSTIVANILPPKRMGEGIGYYGLALSIAMAAGPAIGIWLMGDSNYDRLFNCTAILALAAFFIACPVKYPTRMAVQKRSLDWDSFFEPRLLSLGLVLLVISMDYGGVVSFIAIYALEIGIMNAGLFFLVFSIFVGLSRTRSGRLLDINGPTRVIAYGFASLIAAFVLLAVFRNPVGFLISAAFMGLGFGIFLTSLQAMAFNMIEPHRRGVASSMVMSAVDLGQSSGVVVLGWLADITSLRTMYLVSAFILIIPLILFFRYAMKTYLTRMNEIGVRDGQ